MKILVSGAGGLVGRALVPALEKSGHEVRALTRKSDRGIHWEPSTGALNQTELDRWNGPEAVIHLAGESIAKSRWSDAEKAKIRTSRVEATERLGQTLLQLTHPPSLFIGASAVGIYGSRGDEVLTEEGPPGRDFLAEVARDWERASDGLEKAGIRVIHLRFGMILAKEGGALARMLPIFRAGLGGRLSSGRQWVSWIALEDAVRAIEFCLSRRDSRGAYNAVAPHPVMNAEFTQALAKALHRPAVLPVPAPLLRGVLGEMADALLLASQRAVPSRLLASGFAFQHEAIESALAAILETRS